MQIKWNKVTWYSILLAIIIYIGTFALAFYIGNQFGVVKATRTNHVMMSGQRSIRSYQNALINVATFSCQNNKKIISAFYPRSVDLKLSDGRNFTLNQTISASGARYADTRELIVFWNKGDTAFIEEASSTTYQNCVIK